MGCQEGSHLGACATADSRDMLAILAFLAESGLMGCEGTIFPLLVV